MLQESSSDWLIQKLIRQLTLGNRSHFCIHYMSDIFLRDKAFEISTDDSFHYCRFCNAAKTTSKGVDRCMRNKGMTIQKAMREKCAFIGQCYLGLTEIVRPIFFKGQLCGILYLGHLAEKEKMNDIMRRIKRACKLTHVSEELLLNEIYHTEVISQQELLGYIEKMDILAAAFELCILNYYQNRHLTEQQRGEEKTSVHWIVRQVVNYIEQYYYTDIRLSHIANLYFINPQYLCRIFAKDLGTTFSTYLTQVRVRNAKQLLHEHNKKIIEVAMMVGFNHVTYFNSIFKKVTGLTPSEYRQKIQKDEAL